MLTVCRTPITRHLHAIAGFAGDSARFFHLESA